MTKREFPDTCPECGSPRWYPLKPEDYPNTAHYDCGSRVLRDGAFYPDMDGECAIRNLKRQRDAWEFKARLLAGNKDAWLHAPELKRWLTREQVLDADPADLEGLAQQ